MVEISSKNLLFTECHNIKDIFYSYFRDSSVQFFEYADFTDNCKAKLLSTHPEFTNLIFKNGLNFTNDQFSKLNRYSLLNTNHIPANFDHNKYEMLMNSSKQNFMIDHFFAIYIKTDKHNELFSFGSNANDGLAMNYYINNINLFENFIAYFKTYVKSISQVDHGQNDITIPNFMSNMNINSIEKVSSESSSLKPERMIIKLNNINENISMRERQCLSLTVQGHSAKEIARILAISHRTVEGYIENIKLKFGIAKKSALWKIMNNIHAG